jgi:dTDP-4-dehydrorhamnose 3,5-epimerase
MKFVPLALPGVILVEPDVFSDPRGFFLESYHAGKFKEGGIPDTFVRDNHSQSIQATLRGLHAQCHRHLQAKLVRATAGTVFDVAVDIQRGSPTFKQWVGVSLSASNFRMLYIPPGFAHGFCVLSEQAQVQYKCTDIYDPSDEITLRWDDPEIGISWPITTPILSARDKAAPFLADLWDKLPQHIR